MRKATTFLFSICFAFVASANVFADQVILKNGDRLTGEVVRQTDGNLVFKTKYAGEVVIKWDEVQQLETDATVRLELGENDEKVGKLGTEGSETVVEADSEKKKVELD